MDNYDQRRRHSRDDDRHRSRFGPEDRGYDRESRAESRESEHPSRAERGWLDYDRSYGRSDERPSGRDEERYGRGSDRPRFSPDWSRENEEPRYSDDQYYARNRERGGSDDYSRGREGGRSDDERRWDQRSRESLPREQRELSERSHRGDYYDPDWPYQRRGRGQEAEQRSAEDDDRGSHYRGWYSRQARPFSYPGGSGYVMSESWTLHGPYSGRGPKGYKRSDQQIIEEACQRLERDGEIDASEIEVSAEDGVIKLSGSVPDRQTKRRAEECVESVYGAHDVMNELRVSRQGEQQRERLGDDGSQAHRGSQASQGAQGSQGALGSQSSQQQPSQAGQPSGQSNRPGAGSSSSEASQDGRTSRH